MSLKLNFCLNITQVVKVMPQMVFLSRLAIEFAPKFHSIESKVYLPRYELLQQQYRVRRRRGNNASCDQMMELKVAQFFNCGP